jgi:hypothetical protein
MDILFIVLLALMYAKRGQTTTCRVPNRLTTEERAAVRTHVLQHGTVKGLVLRKPTSS